MRSVSEALASLTPEQRKVYLDGAQQELVKHPAIMSVVVCHKEAGPSGIELTLDRRTCRCRTHGLFTVFVFRGEPMPAPVCPKCPGK